MMNDDREATGGAPGPVPGLQDLRGEPPAPPELWTLVSATTVHGALLRRRLLRQLRAPLAAAALAAVALGAAGGALAVKAYGPAPGLLDRRIGALLREGQALDAMLEARIQNDPGADRARVTDLRARLREADRAVRAAIVLRDRELGPALVQLAVQVAELERLLAGVKNEGRPPA